MLYLYESRQQLCGGDVGGGYVQGDINLWIQFVNLIFRKLYTTMSECNIKTLKVYTGRNIAKSSAYLFEGRSLKKNLQQSLTLSRSTWRRI